MVVVLCVNTCLLDLHTVTILFSLSVLTWLTCLTRCKTLVIFRHVSICVFSQQSTWVLPEFLNAHITPLPLSCPFIVIAGFQSGVYVFTFTEQTHYTYSAGTAYSWSSGLVYYKKILEIAIHIVFFITHNFKIVNGCSLSSHLSKCDIISDVHSNFSVSVAHFCLLTVCVYILPY